MQTARSLGLGLGLALMLSIALPPRALAASILFVSDSGADTGIVTALMADGHDVTMRSPDFSGGSNAALLEDLGAYDAVFWSASGSGSGDAHTDAAVFTNLTSYVMAGGRVFVTGYDSIASPSDPMLVAFLGGTGSMDTPGAAGALASVESSLTIGVVDIRGVTPTGGSGDTDCVTGASSEVTVLASSSSGGCAMWLVRRLGDGEAAYVSNGDSGASSTASWTSTAAGGAGAFNAAIRNFAHAAESASSEMGAPRIEFDGPYSADEGSEVTITVSVTDDEGDPVTFSWDLDGDGTFGERAGETTAVIAAGTTDGPEARVLAVQASDGTHTSMRTRRLGIDNVAPRVTSTPPTTTSVGADLRYAIAVEDPAGAHDPLVYTLTRAPTGITITDMGVLLWHPTEMEVTLPGETHHVVVDIADGDGGTVTHEFDIAVSPNRVPSPPAVQYPANGVVIIDTEPRLVVSDATDPDVEDTLTYFFQLDVVPTFDSEELRSSGAIAQTPGFTAWQLDEPLEAGRTYHWRAWVSDGSAESARAMTSFSVVPDRTMLPDAGPADAAMGGTDAGAPPPPSRGCSITTTGDRASLLPALALAALLVLVNRRRH